MVRTQIQLTEEQARRLKSIAANRGMSMAQVIRQGIDTLLSKETDRSPEELVQRSLRSVGRFRSGKHDVASRHDEYLEREYLK